MSQYLLRLVSHPKNNKLHIDKMIAVSNAPDTLFFQMKDGKKMLKEFIAVDVPENIPKGIRDVFCGKEMVYRFIPPAEKGMTGRDQEFSLTALVIDYQNRNGAEVWTTLERMIEGITPRDKKTPEPIVVAKSHQADFGIGVDDIPVVDLNPNAHEAVTEIAPIKRVPGRPKKEPVIA